jgi:7-cyano-7-deazaguanine synthase in queuosine biosynthesis
MKQNINLKPQKLFLHHFPKVTYRQIQLNGLVDLLDSALVTGGDDVPEGHYAEDNMKATVVPNRNKYLLLLLKQ